MGHFLTQVKAGAEKTCLRCFTGCLHAVETVKGLSVYFTAGPETWELIWLTFRELACCLPWAQ